MPTLLFFVKSSFHILPKNTKYRTHINFRYCLTLFLCRNAFLLYGGLVFPHGSIHCRKQSTATTRQTTNTALCRLRIFAIHRHLFQSMKRFPSNTIGINCPMLIGTSIATIRVGLLGCLNLSLLQALSQTVQILIRIALDAQVINARFFVTIRYRCLSI